MLTDPNRQPLPMSGHWTPLARFSLILLCLTLAAPCPAASPDPPKRVLVIPSYNFNYLGSQWFLEGAIKEFNEHAPFKVTFFHENLQLATHPSNRQYQDTMAASLKIKYALEKPDLIITQYRQALQFMERYGRTIFGDVPVVYSGLTAEGGYSQITLPDNYTGITASFSARGNIELILRNHPSVRKIYVVGGSSPVEQDLVNAAIEEGKGYKGKIEFIALTNLTFQALLAQLDGIRDHSVIMYQALQVDAAGKVFVPALAAREIARAAHVPVYGMLDTYMGSGITGGFLIFHEGMGRRAAEIGTKILLGNWAPGTSLMSEPIGSYRFDWRQLKRWGIDEDTLPAGSRIEFKAFSVWNAYKWEIIGGLCLILLQALLIAGLLTNRFRRIKAENVLRESEERFKNLYDNAPVGYLELDAEGRITNVNHTGLEIMGYSREETVGRYIWSFSVEEDLVRQQALEKLAGRRPTGFALERRYRRKDGTHVPVLIEDRVKKDGQGRITGIRFTLQDITDRKRAEEALRGSEEKAKQLAHENAMMAEIGRIIGSTLNIEVVYARFAEKVNELIPFDRIVVLLFNEDEGTLRNLYVEGIRVPGRQPEDVYPMAGTVMEKVAQMRKGILHRMDDEEAVRAELPGLVPDFQSGLRSALSVPFFSGDRVIGGLALRSKMSGAYTERDLRLAAGVGHQIAGAVVNAQLWSERKRTEDSLKESEGRLRRAQAIGHAGNWEVDLRSRTLWASEETFRIYGIDRTNEVIPLDYVQQLVLPEYRAGMDEALRALIFGNREYDVQFQIRRVSDGEVRFVHSRAERILDEAGTPVKVAGVVQDITERRQLEDQLRQSQKMEAVGQLAGGVAHDFNNILAAIMMRTGLLQNDPDLASEVQTAIRELEEDAKRAAALTRQLLIFSRRESMQIKPLELGGLLGNLIKMLRRVLGEHISLTLQGSTADMWVDGDVGMLEQVVTNLCVNARDAMPNGGRLTIDITRTKIDAESAKAGLDAHAGRFVCLNVSDTGCGMEEGTLRRIFEPFFTTKEIGKGTGLGLSTVYGIVRQHRGWVDVESAVGKGSTFRVYLPETDKPAEMAAASGKESQMQGGTETLLLVEDEQSIRRLGAFNLKKKGYVVLEAANAVEALKVWEERKDEIALLLTDMVMPEGMNGLALSLRLRQDKPALKVIISSGYSPEMVDPGELEKKGIAYLAKPYGGALLTRVVRQCLDSSKGG